MVMVRLLLGKQHLCYLYARNSHYRSIDANLNVVHDCMLHEVVATSCILQLQARKIIEDVASARIQLFLLCRFCRRICQQQE